MASAAYAAWVKAGKPWTLAAPLLQLQRTIQGYGFTVYSYPDEAHQQANTPEDHTSYSATGWPVPSPRWWAFAIDIMPKKSGGMAELAAMARQIIRDKDAGYPGTEWIKYINWTDEGGKTWQTSWKPNKATRTSSDKGHTHISGRSDRTQATIPYDPVARMNEGTDDDMTYLAEVGNAIVVSNSVWCRWVSAGEYPALARKHGNPEKGLPALAVGLLVGAVPPGWPGAKFDTSTVELTDEQAKELGLLLAAEVKAAALSPDVRAAQVEDSFQGAQRAEEE